MCGRLWPMGNALLRRLMYPLEWITTPVSSLSCKNPECGGLLANSLVPSTTQTGSAVVHQSVDHANERTNLTPLSLPLRHHRVLRPSATIRRRPFAVRPLDTIGECPEGERGDTSIRVSALSKTASLETSLVIHWPLFLPAPPLRWFAVSRSGSPC